MKFSQNILILSIQAGYVYFVGATAELIMESEEKGEPFVTFKAFCELHGKENAAEQKL